MDLLSATHSVYQSVTEHGIDTDATEIKRQIEGELELFDITVEEAAEIIESALIEEAENGPRYTPSSLYQDGNYPSSTDDSSTGATTTASTGSPSQSVSQRQSLTSIGPEQNATVEATVVSLWNISVPEIQHRGVLADQSGYLRFTVWSNGSHRQLECGESYRFQTAVTDQQNGEVILNVTPRSAVSPLDTTLTTPNQTRYEAIGKWGGLIAIEGKSGTIARCSKSDCSLVLSNRFCEQHGRIENPEEDYRITALLDDGDSVTRLIFPAELCPALLGLSREALSTKAEELPADTPETDLIERDLIGTHYDIIGFPYKDSLMVGEFQEVSPTHKYTDSTASLIG